MTLPVAESLPSVGETWIEFPTPGFQCGHLESEPGKASTLSLSLSLTNEAFMGSTKMDLTIRMASKAWESLDHTPQRAYQGEREVPGHPYPECWTLSRSLHAVSIPDLCEKEGF